jgi:hypothetical protein
MSLRKGTEKRCGFGIPNWGEGAIVEWTSCKRNYQLEKRVEKFLNEQDTLQHVVSPLGIMYEGLLEGSSNSLGDFCATYKSDFFCAHSSTNVFLRFEAFFQKVAAVFSVLFVSGSIIKIGLYVCYYCSNTQ